MVYVTKDGRVLEACCLRIDEELKETAQALGINLTQAFIDGLELAILKKTKEIADD